jgi:hypothetical protein
MKVITLFTICLISFSAFGQSSEKISTMDFIQIQQDYRKEALFFYKNNWKKLREDAIKKGYIDSFLLLETEASEEAPFHIVLITTYLDSKQYQAREKNFAQLMQSSKGPKLLNSVSPEVFRKKLFSKQKVYSFN